MEKVAVKKSAKKAVKKVAAKKVSTPKAPKEKQFTVLEIKKGWGFNEETYTKQIHPFCKKNGIHTLADFVRAAVKKAYGIENK